MSLQTKMQLLEVYNKIKFQNNIAGSVLYFDPLLKIFSEYPEIQRSEKYLPKKKKIELIFFNKESIHKYLYEKEESTKIISGENSRSLSYCFYLILLLKDKASYTNYIYNINYINDIFKKMEDLDNSLKKIIFSKFICDFIYNFKGAQELSEQEEKELNKKKDICEKNIKNIENLGLGLTIDDIKNNNIDKIYIKIITFLIENNKFEDYDYLCQIIKDLELESINFSENMIKDLLNFLKKDEEILKNYEISEIDDFSNIILINFYYFLFKFVLKNNIYIYQIPFLFKIRKKIIFINSNYDLSYITNGDEKKQLILNFFLGEEYNNALKAKNIGSENRKTTIFKDITDKNNDDKNKLFKKLGNYEWVKLLNNSIFTLKKGNGNTYTYSDIIITYNNKDIKIDYKTFNNILHNEKYNKQDYFDVFIKFSLFLSLIRYVFNLEFQKYENIDLAIKIKFETTLLYSVDLNIQCNYIFPELKDTKSFEDLNLLCEKSVEDFNLMLEKYDESPISLFKKNYTEFCLFIKKIHKFMQNKLFFNSVEQQLHEYNSLSNTSQIEEGIEKIFNDNNI